RPISSRRCAPFLRRWDFRIVCETSRKAESRYLELPATASSPAPWKTPAQRQIRFRSTGRLSTRCWSGRYEGSNGGATRGDERCRAAALAARLLACGRGQESALSSGDERRADAPPRTVRRVSSLLRAPRIRRLRTGPLARRDSVSPGPGFQGARRAPRL